jgi:ribosomal peptide maturation radical SAM protein 1
MTPGSANGAGDLTCDVLLVTMPWDALHMPSLRLGLLAAVLGEHGVSVKQRYFNLLAMEHFHNAPGPRQIELGDYTRTAEKGRSGQGDWVFAVPPFREPPPLEQDEFIALNRLHAVDEEALALLVRMRELAPAILAACLEEIQALRPRIVGFSTTFVQNTSSLALARMVKRAMPQVRIVFGGANCEGPMGEALLRSFECIDVVVRGEAEGVLPGLVDDLLADRPIEHRPGLCFRSGGELTVVEAKPSFVALDELPHPHFDEYFEQLARMSFRGRIAAIVSLPVETSRGCWWGEKHHCTFCGLNGQSMAFRAKSPDRAVDEILSLARRHEVLTIEALDNIISRDYFRNVLPRLRDLGFQLDLFYETKANLTRADVRLLASSGVRRIQPGIESLSTPILRLMKKGVTALQNIRLLKWCVRYGVVPNWNVIYGFPGEPESEYAAMADAARSLTHLPPPDGLFPVSLDRFSPYHQNPAAYGLEVLGPRSFYKLLYPVDEEAATNIAYFFKYRHLDGRNVESYSAPLKASLDEWRRGYDPNRGLFYRRGPGFLKIYDRRFNLPTKVYNLSDPSADIYLACEEGATAEVIKRRLSAQYADLTLSRIRDRLADMLERRLVYVENERYLSLAVPAISSEGDASRDERQPATEDAPALITLHRQIRQQSSV